MTRDRSDGARSASRVRHVIPVSSRVAGQTATRVLPCPFDAVPLQEAMWWHPVHTQDAAHAWLRDAVARVGGQVTDESRP